MKNKHTPQPWRSNDFSSSVYGYIFGDKQAICRVFLDGDECEANARLIAAAPELLEALQGVMYWDNGKPEWDDARAAIAKAVGIKV